MKNKLYFLLLLFLLLLSGATLGFGSPPQPDTNLLKNSSFEDGLKNNIPLYWGETYYNSSIEQGGKIGDYCLRIKNTKPAASMSAHEISIKGEETRNIVVSAYV